MGHYDEQYEAEALDQEHAKRNKRMSENRRWDIRFMKLAHHIASWSKDPSTKVGAVTTSRKGVLGLGYNGFAAGCDDNPALYKDRAQKYPRVVHAEMNALLQTDRLRVNEHITLYSTLPCCADCVGPIINFGVSRVVFPQWTNDEDKERFMVSLNLPISMKMFSEAGVIVDWLD